MSARGIGILVGGAALVAGAATATALALGAPAPSTSGRAASPTADCGGTGTSAAAATTEMRCYFEAVSLGDGRTVCAQLSPGVRAELARTDENGAAKSGDTSADADGLARTSFRAIVGPSTDDNAAGTAPDTSCLTLAPMLDAGYAQLSTDERTRISAEVASARIAAPSVSGEIARVIVTLDDRGRTLTRHYALRASGGRWLIDSLHTADSDS